MTMMNYLYLLAEKLSHVIQIVVFEISVREQIDYGIDTPVKSIDV